MGFCRWRRTGRTAQEGGRENLERPPMSFEESRDKAIKRQIRLMHDRGTWTKREARIVRNRRS